MDTFDLIEYQDQARSINSPKKLFHLWENICQLYDRRQIGKYELDEMKTVIWPVLQSLSRLQLAVDQTFTFQQSLELNTVPKSSKKRLAKKK